MPLIPVLRRQRQVDLREFEATLVYRDSSREYIYILFLRIGVTAQQSRIPAALTEDAVPTW